MTNLKRALLTLAALSLLATSVSAQSRNCTQTCQPTYGGGSSCQLHCY